jgi:15-cis-phytoene synthase
MSGRELDAAGITDPALRESYERCRRLNAAHGRTYYLATLLLPPAKRPYVHALYALARYADELVDDLDAPDPAALLTWGKRFLDDLALGDSTDPIGRAAVHTARTWDIPAEHFEAFLTSMRMDITRTSYATYADLEQYMYGSAAVIGLQMLPLLEPLHPDASIYARELGKAFQMSNFIRDVAEDLRRGRVYLPQEDLDAFGVSAVDLRQSSVNPAVRELLRFEVARNRAIYRSAAPGIGLLHPSSRDCIRTAFRLYGGILDEVEKADYQVLRSRVSVPVRRRLAVAAPALIRARRARRATPPATRRPA